MALEDILNDERITFVQKLQAASSRVSLALDEVNAHVKVVRQLDDILNEVHNQGEDGGLELGQHGITLRVMSGHKEMDSHLLPSHMVPTDHLPGLIEKLRAYHYEKLEKALEALDSKELKQQLKRLL